LKAFKEAEEMKGARERERKGGERGEESDCATSIFERIRVAMKVLTTVRENCDVRVSGLEVRVLVNCSRGWEILLALPVPCDGRC
jgi:hypothetical protein